MRGIVGGVSRHWQRGVWVSALWLTACGGAERERAVEREGCAPSAPASEVGWAGCAGCRPVRDSGSRDGTRPIAIDDAVPYVDVEVPVIPSATEDDPTEAAPPPEEERAATFTALAKRRLDIRTAPHRDAALRGRLGKGRVFHYEGLVSGPGCVGETWARLGEHAFVCMADVRTVASDDEVRVTDEALYYARLRKDRPAPRWASLTDLERGAAPIDELDPDHDYAFVARKVSRSEAVLLDRRGRAVLERDVQRFVPSTFRGRDLRSDPVPPGKTLAWVVAWPSAPVRPEGAREASTEHALPYQTELLLDAGQEGQAWRRTDDGGFVEARSLREWSPVIPRPPHMDADEVWIDVDLDRQILTVLAGDAPIFVTLVSSGRRSPTPRGIFRVQHKLVEDTMTSAPGADDVYEVEAVPFVQYFAGGYALHGAYWHNRFGRPLSHGCVNLSPADAKQVFALTGPHLGPGWAEAFETVHERGTVVQVRRGAVVPVDRRREPVFVLVDG